MTLMGRWGQDGLLGDFGATDGRELYSGLGGKRSELLRYLGCAPCKFRRATTLTSLSPGVQEKYVCRAGEIRFQDGTIYVSRDLICSEPAVLREIAFTN